VTVRLVYETHATSTDNEAGIATGWRPGRLSRAGRANAEALGRRRRDDGLAAVLVSDLARAVETVRIAFDGCDLPVHVDARLRECSYGDLDGSLASALPRSEHVDTPFPGGESYRDVVRRTADLLADLAQEWDGARLLVVAHSANRWAIEHLLLGRDLAELVSSPFGWQEGWEYDLPAGWAWSG
jgi:broad specificity phosphatase PhoE